MDPHALATELAPHLETILQAKRADFEANAGGPARRWLVRQAWPTVMGWLPALLESALALFAWKFAAMTVGEIVYALMEARKRTPEVGEALGLAGRAVAR